MRPSRYRGFFLILILAAFVGGGAPASAQPVCRPCVAGVVLDGPWERNDELRGLIEEEVLDLVRHEFQVSFPIGARRVGDWSLDGARDAVDQLLGIIALAGIVINNAIVLIDRIGIEIDQNGLPPARAIVEAAQRRFRPILLTTATTVAGLLPLWFGGGPMYEPMAIAIIFGLLFATMLTLGLVPVLYTLFFRVSFKGFSY